MNQCIEIKMLQREIDNIKQMYMFTVNSAKLHSIKQVMFLYKYFKHIFETQFFDRNCKIWENVWTLRLVISKMVRIRNYLIRKGQ